MNWISFFLGASAAIVVAIPICYLLIVHSLNSMLETLFGGK